MTEEIQKMTAHYSPTSCIMHVVIDGESMYFTAAQVDELFHLKRDAELAKAPISITRVGPVKKEKNDD